MAPEPKKRARPVPKTSQRSKKRQKIEPVKNGSAKVEKRAVALDALPWNEVEMPDMFEDAEGFFGLEEVEGVEVIREGDTVKFVRNVHWQQIRTYSL
jgi:ATP-dependent RNA helicase DDX24/MAK5